MKTYIYAAIWQDDGADWMKFGGEITVSDQVNVGGFKAAGFSVKVRGPFFA